MKTKIKEFSVEDLIKMSGPPAATVLQAGDKVTLRSGGPIMTVTKVVDGRAYYVCNQVMEGNLPIECLTLVETCRFN